MTPTPKFILRFMLGLSLFCGVTALAGIALAFKGQQWYMLAFESVVLITAVPCALLAAGRLDSGGSAHAMGMLCLGGVVGVTAALIDPQLVKALIQRQTPQVQPVAGINVMPWILARLAVGAVLVGLSALTVLLRRPGRSFPLLLKGIAFGIPVMAVGVAVVIPSLRGRLVGLPPVAIIILAIAGTVVLGALISASGHLIIRAFAVGLEEGEPARR